MRAPLLIPSLFLICCAGGSESGGFPEDRIWLGAEYWANPMEDWRLSNGRMECLSEKAGRNVHILTRDLGTEKGTLDMKVRIGRSVAAKQGAAGFRIGINGEQNDYRENLIRGKGLDCGIRQNGTLFIGSQTEEASAPTAEIDLRLQAVPENDAYTITLAAHDPATGEESGKIVRRNVAASSMVGNLALVSNPELKDLPDSRLTSWWFQNWTIQGTKVRSHPDRTFGPILWAMHTVSRGVMKMTAQMPPVDGRVTLEIRHGDAWKKIADEEIHEEGRTALFRIENWDTTRDVPYRLLYSGSEWTGTVRKEPDGRPVVVAGFTGNTDAGFPNNDLVRNVGIHDPDVLFFSGDQLYESVGGFGIIRTPADRSILNYLRKWYLLGWAFRDLMRDRLTICLPDDHDVYQGNIWGNGGNPTTMPEHSAGGYAQPAAMVNAVHRTQTGHHPDAFDPTPIQQGISVYYGDMLYGRVGFAIIADRMFKSGPKGKVNEWKGRPRSPQRREL